MSPLESPAAPSRRLLLGTSWKMNKTSAQADTYAERLCEHLLRRPVPFELFVLPPYTLIRRLGERLAGSGVVVGAQNLHWEDQGPWTGEISAPMLKDCGAQIAEIGHSERRAHFNETDEVVGRKVAAALRHGLLALVCVGETRTERDRHAADEVLERQVLAALEHVTPAQAARLVFAYEPVWAIGVGGEPAPPELADARMAGIRRVVADRLGTPVRVLYGGSVNATNCVELCAQPHVDGLFIGRAAWEAEGFAHIIDLVAAANPSR